MREIKVRFKWKSLDVLDPDNRGFMYLSLEELNLRDPSLPLLLPCGEYIGLKDKNGKEIYEGDIVETENEILTITYGTQYKCDYEVMGFNLFLYEGQSECPLEIIGNIYCSGGRT